MLRYQLLLISFTLIFPAFSWAASAKEAMALMPIQRDDVPMDTVSEKEVDDCRLERLQASDAAGYEVFSADNIILRRFVDTNNDRKLDVWSYFAAGVEVYRDMDTDFNGKADQYRWLGTAGSRWGIDKNEDTKIDSWKQISAQEVTYEIVHALASKDSSRFERLLPLPSQLKSVGLQGDFERKVQERIKRASGDFAELLSSQKVVTATSHWTYFAASAPGTVPAGSEFSEQDLLVHEGVIAMLENEGKTAQVFVGTLIQTADGWRAIDLPNPVAEGKPMSEIAGLFFVGKSAPGNGVDSGASSGNGAEAFVAELEKIDRQMAAETSAAAKSKLHQQRAEALEKIATGAAVGEREMWWRQLIDTVATAVYSGEFSQGLPYLQKLPSKMRQSQPNLEALASYQAKFTEYMLRQSAPKADLAKVQEWWLNELQEFVTSYARAPETAEALRQLGFNSELENKEDEAKKWYSQAASKFPNTEAGKKSEGAVRRLGSVGRDLELKGTTMDRQAFDIRSLKGRPVVIQYWATWCEPCIQDMRMLRTLVSRYSDRKLAVVGVNVDETRQKPTDFLKANPVAWPQLFEDGGLENSPLATQLGVQTLPMMILIDASGKVVRHSILSAELDAAISELK